MHLLLFFKISYFVEVVHDGPVNAVSRSPHYSDLILTVGGNLLIIWRETELNQPLIVKSSDQVHIQTPLKNTLRDITFKIILKKDQ